MRITHAAQHIQTVIAPVSTGSCNDDMEDLLDFSLFPSLCHLTIVYGDPELPRHLELFFPVLDITQLTDIALIPPDHEDLKMLDWSQPKLTFHTAYSGIDTGLRFSLVYLENCQSSPSPGKSAPYAAGRELQQLKMA